MRSFIFVQILVSFLFGALVDAKAEVRDNNVHCRPTYDEKSEDYRLGMALTVLPNKTIHLGEGRYLEETTATKDSETYHLGPYDRTETLKFPGSLGMRIKDYEIKDMSPHNGTSVLKGTLAFSGIPEYFFDQGVMDYSKYDLKVSHGSLMSEFLIKLEEPFHRAKKGQMLVCGSGHPRNSICYMKGWATTVPQELLGKEFKYRPQGDDPNKKLPDGFVKVEISMSFKDTSSGHVSARFPSLPLKDDTFVFTAEQSRDYVEKLKAQGLPLTLKVNGFETSCEEATAVAKCTFKMTEPQYDPDYPHPFCY